MADVVVRRVDRRQISPNTVNMIWQSFRNEYQKNPELYLEEEVYAMETDPRTIRRFYSSQNYNLDKTTTALVNAMQWRKRNNVNTLSESELPLEFFRSGLVFSYGRDRENNTLLICRVKAYKKFEEWTETLQKYVVFLVEREDRRAENNDSTGVTIVLDYDEVVYSSKNSVNELLSFMVALMTDYYPGLLESVIVYRLHIAYNSFLQHVIPEARRVIFKFANKLEDMLKFVDSTQLPDFMGGTSALPYRMSPTNAPNMYQFAETHHLNADQYLKHLEPFLFSD